MHSEAIPEPSRAERVGSVLDSLVGSSLASGMTANQRASVAWHAANGDRERAHTTRVFLRKGKVEGSEPIICVYVDSHAFLTDLNANRDIYLSRLANWGFFVSDIRFEVDRNAHKRVGQGKGQLLSAEKPAAEAPKLSAEQQAYVDELVAQAPESLRESISKAIVATMLAESKKASQNEN